MPTPTTVEALHLALERVAPLPLARLPLADVLGLALAEDVVSRDTIPPFVNSAMDGYAVRAADVAAARADAPARLAVLEDVPAGRSATRPVAPGTAIRIMTGAPLPDGADAVVKVEETKQDGDAVLVLRAEKLGANVRRAGEDVRAGERALAAGTTLRAAEIGLLAALGVAEPLVRRRPRVAVVTTGDELVDVAENPGPGQIRDANIHAMCAQLRALGAEPLPFPRVADRREAVREALGAALAAADMVLTNGGISVGDYDFVKGVLAELGAHEVFWKVRQKPGGPLGFYVAQGKPVFGLPGNPVAAQVCIEEYARPTLRAMMGHARLHRPSATARLVEGYRKSGQDGKLHFVRIFAQWSASGLEARTTGPQGSGLLTSMVGANGLALVPADAVEIPPGGAVTVHLTDLPEDR